MATPLVTPTLAAAHELKAPLALTRQLALRLGDPSLSEVERERLTHRIVLTSERALRLTSDLTKAARLEDALFTLGRLTLSRCVVILLPS